MNITFLIGNGFDLNLGLKTKYSDFIEEYKKTAKINVQRFSNGKLKEVPVSYLDAFKIDLAHNERKWSNAEEEFGKYTEKFSGEEGMNLFLDCHEDFCKSLGKYLECEESKLDYSLLKDLLGKAFLKAIFNTDCGFKEVQQKQIFDCYENVGSGLKYSFISFNYTKTLDNCISYIKADQSRLGSRRYKNNVFSNTFEQFIHVHGYTDHEMALGLNDETQIVNRELFNGAEDEDLAQIIKRYTNKINEQNIDEKTFQILKSSDFIYIYGMSIGKTDAVWWQRICNLMLEKNNMHIVIHQFDAPDEELFLRNFRKYERKIRNDFISFYDGDIDEIKPVLSRIHITKANIFVDLFEIIKNTTKVQISENISQNIANK